MILQALVDYYDRIQAAGEDVAASGHSAQKIAFCVVLEADGTLVDIQDIRQRDGKRTVPQLLIVPGQAKPSGSGINPGLLWDNPQYMLGYKADDPKPGRTAEAFAAFRQRHLDLRGSINHPDFDAVCTFLGSWAPEKAAACQTLQEFETGFGVFRIRGHKQYVHEVPEIATQAIASSDGDADAPQGQCLVTGRTGNIATLHEPALKGVSGAQSSGAKLVSFNKDAFASYGKDQGANAPVSEETAFKYATGLNHLLRSDNRHRVQVGDATTLFWTEAPTEAESLFGVVFASRSAEDEETRQRVGAVLQRVARGAGVEELGPPETRFFVLGLSPNAARVSVRYWHVSTLREMCERLATHFDHLGIVGNERNPFPSVWHLLAETVRKTTGGPPPAPPPILAGAILRSILTGSPYPQALYSAVLRRIRADRVVNAVRAAILKAYLIRNHGKEIPMGLDTQRPEVAYHLGRLFAVLEKVQEDSAESKINATIKDRYFSAASATPGCVFPRLNRLSQHHLAKLSPGQRITHEKRIQGIYSSIDTFPAHLALHDQGLFAIGYYHQRQDLFTKKTDETIETPETTPEA